MTRAYKHLDQVAKATAGHMQWVEGLTDPERWAMHDEAARALHVGHISLGRHSSMEGHGAQSGQSMLLWKWAEWGGPGQCVQWDVCITTAELGAHVLTVKGVLAAGVLTASGASGQVPQDDRRIRDRFSKAVFTRRSEDGRVWWDLLPKAPTVFLGGQIPTAQQHVCLHSEPGSGLFSGEIKLCGYECSLVFDQSTIRPQGTREAAGLVKPAKRDSLALIQVLNTNGVLREVSRGFVLADDWHQTGNELKSDSEPRCKQHLVTETPVDKTLISDPTEWKVTTKSLEGGAPVKPRRWKALTLPAEIDGAGFLDAFEAWRAAHNLGSGPSKRGRGLLHSNTARGMLATACFSTDAPYQLLVEIILAAERAEDPEVLQLVHAVVGAFPASPAESSMPSTCRYVGLQRDLQLTMLQAIHIALTGITGSLQGSVVSSGLCRLPALNVVVVVL